MAIVITKQPTNVAANVNDTVSITLEATGDGLVYDWQYSSNGTKFYSLSASASASNWTYDQPTLTFRGYSDYLKYYFRCKITDFNGDSVFSNIVRTINLAKAGAGFILPETLHGIAEAIRAKTETTDKILPADMAGLIEGLGGSCEVLTGSFIAPVAFEVYIGLTLPETDNFVFVCYLTTSAEGNHANGHVHALLAKKQDGGSVTYKLLSAKNGTTLPNLLTYTGPSYFKITTDDVGTKLECELAFLAKKYEWWCVYG